MTVRSLLAILPGCLLLGGSFLGCASVGPGANTVGEDSASGLNFNYTVSGNAPWRPVAVANNGSKTIIEMPAAMAQTEAPTLLVVRKPGGLFGNEELALVNYRVQGNRYIVDSLFGRAVLIAGVGAHQDRVTIRRGR